MNIQGHTTYQGQFGSSGGYLRAALANTAEKQSSDSPSDHGLESMAIRLSSAAAREILGSARGSLGQTLLGLLG